MIPLFDLKARKKVGMEFHNTSWQGILRSTSKYNDYLLEGLPAGSKYIYGPQQIKIFRLFWVKLNRFTRMFWFADHKHKWYSSRRSVRLQIPEITRID